MLHTKFRGNRLPVPKKDFEGFYLIWAWQLSWSCDRNQVNKFSFPCT